MNVYQLCGNNGLFGKYSLNREHCKLRCSKWTSSTISFGILKAYGKLTRQPGLERVFRVVDRRMRKQTVDAEKKSKEIDAVPETKQVISVAEAEKITEDMINSYSNNRMMRELIESASLFAGAENIGGARTMRKSRLQITKFEITV